MGEEEGFEQVRRSKDYNVNKEGRKLCDFVEEQGWTINGNIRGDEEGEWTYTGGEGKSVIDYVMGDERTKEKVEKMVVKDRVDSDHHPLAVWIKGGEGERRKEKGIMRRGN